MPKKDFIKRYGQKTVTSVSICNKQFLLNMVKKQAVSPAHRSCNLLSLNKNRKGDNMNEMKYKDKFKAAMKDFDD